MLQNMSFTLSEGIEKIKTEKIRKKVRRKERGFLMEWFNSVLVIPAPSSAPYKHGQSEGFTAGYEWQSVTRHCKERLYLGKPTKEELGYASCADESIQGYSGEVR